MSGWAEGINATVLKLDNAHAHLLPAVAAEVHNSIVFGSPLTGSPGQVVQDIGGGNLRDSWQLTFPTPDTAQSSTNVVYAEPNETGIREDGGAYIQRSAIGGRHSVALTRMGFSRIVDDVAAKLTAGGDPRPVGFQDNTVLGGSGS